MKKRMAQVIDGRTMSVGEILGGAAQDSKGAQLKFKKVKDSYPPVFEAKGTDNKVYSLKLLPYLSGYLLGLLRHTLETNRRFGCVIRP